MITLPIVDATPCPSGRGGWKVRFADGTVVKTTASGRIFSVSP